MSSSSGIPRDKAFWTIRKSEIDYEGQIAEFSNALRSVRRASIGIVAIFGTLAAVLAIAGKTATASGIVVMIVAPFALVLAIMLMVALAMSRSGNTRR